MINLQSRAWRATIAAALLLVEALVVLSLAIYLVVQNFIADNVDDRHALLGEIIYATAGAAVLALLAWGFFKNKTAQRAPSVLINLIFLGVSTYMFSEGLWLLGSITFLISATTVVAAVSVIPD
jgi:F0F1-type ATP synthase assembly protein I